MTDEDRAFRANVQQAKDLADLIARKAAVAHARVDARRQKGRGGARNWGQMPVNNLISDLMFVYEFFTGRRAVTSVGGPESREAGKARGPLIRFLAPCLKAADVHLSDEIYPVPSAQKVTLYRTRVAVFLDQLLGIVRLDEFPVGIPCPRKSGPAH